MYSVRHRTLFFALFTLSGFAGLIYESIWSHYLKLFLGHAAYAQTLVLAIFMGGMALGAALCGKYSARWRNLLLAYAVTEALIGVAALVFHDAFDGFLQFAYFQLIPALGSPQTVEIFKWTSAALLILPQSILLGMTFPLMSAGIIRRFPDTPGRSVATLYFTNSIGAAAGVLVSGFVLVGAIGLPGTIRVAGVINLIIAALVWALIRNAGREPEFSPQYSTATPSAENKSWTKVFLAIALFTGFASFIYEIAWIRMLSLVLGSSTHAFELMLSAFILGLALGGLWIKRVIDRLPNPVTTLAGIQIVMGVLAIATLPLYDQSFEFMHWIMNNTPATADGYLRFNLASHAIAAVIMLPATFCAGMTLPLITYALMQRGEGEKSIGNVYAANTVGAIAGVFFATHLALPGLGLKNALVLGAAIDILLGAYLLYRFRAVNPTLWVRLAPVFGFVIVLTGIWGVTLDPHHMASGVYRQGRLLSPDKVDVIFHQDGKTASVDVLRSRERGDVTISTNGKPDASIHMAPGGRPTADEVTMVMAGALPLAMLPNATTAAVIGFGSGLTTHTLAGNPQLATVDTVEIERAMIRGAEAFRPRVENAYSSPNSHVYIDDAKTFFSTHGKRYDVIVSEPSNPWVSGVSSLFTEEFYRHIKHFLNRDGLLVQWIQVYETDVELIASIVKALSTEFPDYVIYAASDDDMLLIAGNGGMPAAPSAGLFAIPGMAEELSLHGIRHLQDLELHRIGDQRSLQALFAGYAIAANSDYFPVLDTRAAKSRFLHQNANELLKLNSAGIPMTRMLSSTPLVEPTAEFTPNVYLTVSDKAYVGALLRDFVIAGQRHSQYDRTPNDLQFYAQNVRMALIECSTEIDPTSWLVSVVGLAQATLPFLSRDDSARLWQAAQTAPCYAQSGSTKQAWLRLMQALAQHDASAMQSIAAELLADPERDAAPIARFLLQAAVLGSVMQEQRDAARATWEQYAPLAYPNENYDLLARLYMSHAGANGLQ